MKHAMLTLTIAVLASACMPEEPEGAIPLANAEPVVAAILERWGTPKAKMPPVYGVPTTCQWNEDWQSYTGFRNPEGVCVGGRTLEDGWGNTTGVYLSLWPGARFNHALPHEMIHVFHGLGHKRPDRWSIHDPMLSLEALTQAWLASQPDLDVMPVAIVYEVLQ